MHSSRILSRSSPIGIDGKIIFRLRSSEIAVYNRIQIKFCSNDFLFHIFIIDWNEIIKIDVESNV